MIRPQIIKPFSKLDHSRHIGIVVRILKVIIHLHDPAVKVKTACIFLIEHGIVDFLRRLILRFLKQAASYVVSFDIIIKAPFD